MTQRRTGWPRGRTQWAVGTAVLFALGIILGTVLGSVWLGLAIALLISLGWLMAYESWRGRTVGLDDPDDNGAQL